MSKRRIVMFCIVSIFIFCMISLGLNHLKENQKKMISGGEDTHWYHSTGKIEDIDLQNRIITVNISDEESSEEKTIKLDCRNENVRMETANVKIGNEITFSYFRHNFMDSEVLVEAIELPYIG